MGRPWRVVGADASRVGAGGGGGGFRKLVDLPQMGLGFRARSLAVAAGLPRGQSPCGAPPPREHRDPLEVAEVRGLLGTRVPERKRSCCVSGAGAWLSRESKTHGSHCTDGETETSGGTFSRSGKPICSRWAQGMWDIRTLWTRGQSRVLMRCLWEDMQTPRASHLGT